MHVGYVLDAWNGVVVEDESGEVRDMGGVRGDACEVVMAQV